MNTSKQRSKWTEVGDVKGKHIIMHLSEKDVTSLLQTITVLTPSKSVCVKSSSLMNECVRVDQNYLAHALRPSMIYCVSPSSYLFINPTLRMKCRSLCIRRSW
jgi:hypothetical protein